ncbi:SDR family NAD(P)-dependent oxidoreductase [Leeia sp.]|uniref:SDR family NAD(P)-dependent oxidoreductase n=1 Tax=Leeia sp. TaxID=2884678 RepID=UPI0035AFD998
MPDTLFAHYPSLAGKVVFVTGGSSGIGADIVTAFALQGAKVAFAGRNAEAAAQVLARSAAAATQPVFLRCDLADMAALKQAIDDAVSHFGDVDILINNAANDDRHAFLDVTPEYFDQRVAINLKVHFFAAQAVIPGMQRKGAGVVVNLGSTSWKVKGAGYCAYATCKSATTGLTRSLAREFGKDRIRVNTLTPGWVMTDRQLNHWVDEAGEKAMNDNHCLPGRIQGIDIANMALFLAAEDSRMITAQEFIVDAGWT